MPICYFLNTYGYYNKKTKKLNQTAPKKLSFKLISYDGYNILINKNGS